MVATRAYGQYCGFARAIELIGERWAMLLIRDLLVGPKRFTDLQRGLPKIPSNVLTTRLKELEESGIVRRRAQPRPAGGIAYELTEDGQDLEKAVIALGRWGAKHLDDVRPDEIVTDDSMAMALRTTFRPEAAARDDIAFELRLGEVVVNAKVRKGTIVVGRGPLPAPDLVIESGPAIRALMAGEITPKQALKDGTIHVRGKRALLDRFVAIFRI
ncbi:MAG TPA: helix-turn-helix domain-containing protein [Candidatus Baltobacteraceae bacterium]|jgi:DNA-binding HxlR family transcriptional regulator